ncbi:MAG: Trk system potassium transporter TrkA [Clostridia bacterium]|nr:Trk system potassium transporter TrkA [Clostridia bacterium]
MQVVIIGLGQIGQELAKELAQKKHDVTVIDKNKELIDNFTNKYEAIGIVGSGASRDIQTKARCDTADLVIGLTGIDEINLMSCLTAKYLGAKYTVAKVKSLEYQNNDVFLKQKFKIDLVINSEHSTADEITRTVSYPSNIIVEHFFESKIDMAEITLREGSPLIGMSINELEERYKNKIKIGCIYRNEKAYIPTDTIQLKKDDTIYVLAKIIDLHKFLKKNKLIEKTVKSVLLVGSGNIGEQLIINLTKIGIKIKVIEFNLDVCRQLSEKFDNIEVVYCEEINSEVLVEEGIKQFDCCISLTQNDESNLVVSMFAWSCKNKKIITKITSIAYTSMLHNVKIDTTISPYSIILSSIIKYIKGIKNSLNNSIKELYRIANNQIETIEFYINKDYDFCNKPLCTLKIKPNALIASVVRGKEVIMANENIELKTGDKVIVISKVKNEISELEDVFY